MKIAHVVSTFPPHIGGMGAVCFNEAKELAARGHEVVVFTLKYPNFGYNDTAFPFKVVRIKPWVRLGDAGFVPQLLWKLNGFDIVHLHYPFYGGAEFVLRNKKLIVTYHMDAAPGGIIKKIIQSVYDFFIPYFVFRSAKKIIAVDADHIQHTRFSGSLKDKCIEITNGVDANVFQRRNVPWSELNLTELENKKVVLFVGNPLPFKRLDLVIKAISKIGDSDLRLLVVAGGYEIERYKKLTRELDTDNRILFVGSLNDQIVLSKYYSNSKCLVLSSDKAESFSLVLLEAMACECPVIASDIPGVRGRINNGVDGLLFRPGNAEELKNAIIKILNLSEEERNKMGEAGRPKVMKEYIWKTHVDKLEKVYKV